MIEFIGRYPVAPSVCVPPQANARPNPTYQIISTMFEAGQIGNLELLLYTPEWNFNTSDLVHCQFQSVVHGYQAL